MGHIIRLLAVGSLLTLSACRGGMSANETAGGSRSASSSVFMTTASDVNGMTPLIRYVSDDAYHMSIPQDPGNPMGSQGMEGGLVMVSMNPGPGLHPVYTCLVRVNRTYSTGAYMSASNPSCDGGTMVSLGSGPYYLSDVPTATMSRPLYRCVQLVTHDHLDTTDLNECYAAGYQPEGDLGYGG